MAKSKNHTKKLSYISVPSQLIDPLSSSSLQSLLVSPKKSSKSSSSSKLFGIASYKSPRLWFLTLFLFCLFGMLRLGLNLDNLIPFSPYPCVTSQSLDSTSNGNSESQMGFALDTVKNDETSERDGSLNDELISFPSISNGYPSSGQKDEVVRGGERSQRLTSNGYAKSMVDDESNDESEFWKQPDGMGYRPCLEFTRDYRRQSEAIVKGRTRYLMAVVSGGMNQQRNQIVDAVVIARILGAALVVPILQVNVIWGDESEFSDIFDLEHFKRVLANDVRIVSTLPSTHVMARTVEESRTPFNASPQWIRAHYLRKIKRDGVLLLRSLDSRLSKDLPSDLEKLRCKVAFHALRFAPRILELGNKLAERMQNKGPYIALHLRMEKDVWVRTGCFPGLSPEYDEMISNERKQRPELLTARSNMTYHERKLAGLCPMNALEMKRLLKALGAPKNARIYWAGGQPLGGKKALLPLTREFPHFYNKEDLALPGELEPFANKASLLAAIDYIVCEKSDVFMPSHGGNMGHAIQGHRAFAGHKKYITPNKRHMLPYFLNTSLPEPEFKRIMKELHQDSLGQPELRTLKAGRDVTKFPVPECMCNK